MKILHLASHARAGETMMLRALSCHPRVHVPVQVTQDEDPESVRFVNEVRLSELTEIPETHWYYRAKQLRANQLILLKQGVWAPAQNFKGVVLVRNPLSFVFSVLEFNRQEGLTFSPLFRDKIRYSNTMERLLRWSHAMSDDLVNEMSGAKNVVDALCIFYCHRVSWLRRTGLPIFHYESLVSNFKYELMRACNELGLEWSYSILDSHNAYIGLEGHGKNDLTRLIDRKSLNKWMGMKRKTRAHIIERTNHVARAVGYSLSQTSVEFTSPLQ